MGKGSATATDADDDLIYAPTEDNVPEVTESVAETAPEPEDEPERTEPVNIGPDRGSQQIVAGWDGLYWLFGARAERFDVTPEGIYAIGVTMSAQYDLSKIVADMMEHGPKRIDLLPTYFWLSGAIPDQLDDSVVIQQYGIQFFRGAGEKDTSKFPDYFKTAAAEYKKAFNVGAPRGRKRTVVKLEVESLDSVSEEMLEGVGWEKLDALRRTVEAAMERQHAKAAIS